MGSDSDLSVSLPVPPPPNPAARRAAIDSAMRRFDGIADSPSERPRRPSLWQWASTHRGAAGGLVTAALIAVISIPAIQIAIQDHPQEAANEDSPSDFSDSPMPVVANEEPAARAGAMEAPTAEPPQTASPVVGAAQEISKVGQERTEGYSADQKGVISTVQPPPVMRSPAGNLALAAPPPPPPPPPAPVAAEPEAQAADVGSIIVTGSRVRRPNLESATPVTVVGRELASDPFGDFLSQVQGAFADNDRRAILRMVGLPLRVRFAGETRTYRTRQDVERDYDRIFTPAVRQSVVDAGNFESRDARLKSAGRLSFGCGNRTCSSADTIRIREVNP